MLVTKIKNREVVSIPFLHRLVLKKVFNQKEMTIIEEKLIEQAIEYWPKKTVLSEEEKKELKIIVEALIGNENGAFDDMKEAMVEHSLDYRKVYSEGIA